MIYIIFFTIHTDHILHHIDPNTSSQFLLGASRNTSRISLLPETWFVQQLFNSDTLVAGRSTRLMKVGTCKSCHLPQPGGFPGFVSFCNTNFLVEQVGENPGVGFSDVSRWGRMGNEGYCRRHFPSHRCQAIRLVVRSSKAELWILHMWSKWTSSSNETSHCRPQG